MTAKTTQSGRRGARAETIPVENPDHLRAIAGPHDRHLVLLESLLDVHLEAPGGGVRVVGDPDARARARAVIGALRDRVATGAEIVEQDVRATARAALGADQDAIKRGVVRVGAKTYQARTANQALYLQALADANAALTFGVGPAGTGKTFLAVLYGASLLAAGEIQRLIVCRPAVEAGEKLGYLPGDLIEKVDPYMLPIWDALSECFGKRDVEKKRESGEIEVAPLAFMRGRTLRDAFVIVDEAQNATVSQMQMVLTRIGEGTRMAVTGDPSQVDLPSGQRSGLSHALEILRDLEGVRAIEFSRDDVQRHPLVGRIVDAYRRDREAAEQTTSNPSAPKRAKRGKS